MIEINFVPEELRRKKKAFTMPEINVKFIPLVGGAAALLIAVHLLLILTLNIKRATYERMEAEWENIGPGKSAVELIKRENIEAKKNLSAIEGLVDSKALWSKKLNQLSDLVIPGVWFTKISLNKKIVAVKSKEGAKNKKAARAGKSIAGRIEVPYLDIEGEVSSVYGDELAVIGKFIESLKDDSDFFKDFSNIELVGTKLGSIGDIEVMKFNIHCYLRQRGEDEAG